MGAASIKIDCNPANTAHMSTFATLLKHTHPGTHAHTIEPTSEGCMNDCAKAFNMVESWCVCVCGLRVGTLGAKGQKTRANAAKAQMGPSVDVS